MMTSFSRLRISIDHHCGTGDVSIRLWRIITVFGGEPETLIKLSADEARQLAEKLNEYAEIIDHVKSSEIPGT